MHASSEACATVGDVTVTGCGEHVVGELVVRIEPIDAKDVLATPRFVRPQVRWMFVSAAAHATVLVAAFLLSLHADPARERAEQIEKMRGYLAHMVEQPIDSTSYVETPARFEEERDDRPGTSGDGAREDVHRVATPTANAETARAPREKTHQPVKRGGGSGAATGASSCAAFARAGHEPNATWIEFSLVDTAQHPVPGEPYKVTLPDGTVREGKTDARGLICFTGVKPGSARIEWPRLGNAAQYVGSNNDPI